MLEGCILSLYLTFFFLQEAIQGITVVKEGHMAFGFHQKSYQLRNSEGRDLIDLRGGSSLKYRYKGLFIAVKTWWILFI